MYVECPAPQLFDPSVAHCAVRFRVEDYTPEAVEKTGVILPSTMDRAVNKRKAEYVAGRLCAMRALHAQTGRVGVNIAAGTKGEPVWPAGWVGSITHTHGFAAAAVADARFMRSLGLDTEQIMTAQVMQNVATRICRPEEAYDVRLPVSPEVYTTLVFSAKESLFKCLFPLVGKMFWFEDARIEIADYQAGAFTAVLMSDLSEEFCCSVRLDGRFYASGGLIHTGISLACGTESP